MVDMLAIVKRTTFDEQAEGAKVGDVLAWRNYESEAPRLEALARGSQLFLVTVRPPDERLWLVAIYQGIRRTPKGWRASQPNVTPIVDITRLRSKLRFDNGKGLISTPGRLANSLQTPRILTAKDLDLLAQAIASSRGIPRHPTPRRIDAGKPVLALQFDGKGGRPEQEHLAVMVLAGALSFASEKPKGSGWTFCLGVDRPHVEGLSTWLGIGPGVPGDVVDLIQKLLTDTQHRVRREYADPHRHGLAPIVFATDEDIEVSESGPDDDFLKEHFDEDARLARRAFVVDPSSKTQQLHDLFFGSDPEAAD